MQVRTTFLPPPSVRSWRVAVAVLLSLVVVWLSSRYVLFSVGVRWIWVIGPALLLYSGLYGLAAIVQAVRNNERTAATMLWEGVGWATLGLVVGLYFRQRYLILPWWLVLAGAVVFDQRLRHDRRLHRWLLTATGLLVGILFLLPLIWMINTSLRGAGLPQPTRLEWLPVAPALANYARLLALVPLHRYLANSIGIALVGVPLSLGVAAAAAFSLLHLPARWRRAVLLSSLVGLAVPSMALWLPRFLVYRALGLLNTPLVLLAPALLGGSPLTVLLLYRAFRRVSGEQWDQARLDGAGPLVMWWQIALPQVRNVLLALGALVFGIFWGNFVDPLLYLQDATWQTLPVVLQSLQQLTRSDWPVLMAASVIATLPTVLVFALAQRALLGNIAFQPGERA